MTIHRIRMDKDEGNEKLARIRAITKLYYSNPKVQEALLNFSVGREVVPRYFEGFGKRPDTLQYKSDIMGLVNKGATSFHASEEIWNDPLAISSDMSTEKLNELRKSWDLLIDIDSKYLDYSKIAAKLMIQAIESFGINNYGIKFSGSRGFHIIISGEAFPEEYDGSLRKDKFPEWPRAICEYLTMGIRPRYNEVVSKLDINFDALEKRTNLSKEDITEVICPKCGRQANKGNTVHYQCPDCRFEIKRKDVKLTQRALKCGNDKCVGTLELIQQEPYYFCDYCKISNIPYKEEKENKKITYTKEATNRGGYSEYFVSGIAATKLAGLDMVLVAPRHLFRMPYSLHEKSALASIVIKKEEIDNFAPKDANPLSVSIREFLFKPKYEEGKRLLAEALAWKKKNSVEEEQATQRKYEKSDYPEIKLEGVTKEMFPKPIKKLLNGLQDGKKRGLFILITFLRSLGFSPEYIDKCVFEWNKKNEPPLREGYVKSQIDWHLKQKKKILPPNYGNESFYKDLNLLDEKPKVKNPIVEVMQKIRKGNSRSR